MRGGVPPDVADGVSVGVSVGVVEGELPLERVPVVDLVSVGEGEYEVV